MTSSPEFGDPVRTAPFLDAERAFPDPRQVIVIESNVPSLDFGALVRSEDVGSPIETRLLLDYGWPNTSNGKPYRREFAGKLVPASTFDDETRIAEVKWDPISMPMAPGCHRLTLMVSHNFSGETGCSTDEGDYSQVTWTILRCAAEGCPTIDLTDTQKVDEEDPSCPPVEATCAAPVGQGGASP